MKKGILICLLAFIPIASMAQKVKDRIEDDKSLSLGTDYQRLNSHVNMKLCYYLDKSTGEEMYSLDFVLTYSAPNSFSFDKGAPLYIKTLKNNIIVVHEIISNDDVNFNRGSISTNSNAGLIAQTIGAFIPTDPYYLGCSYFITPEELSTVIKEGVKGIYFLTTAGYMIVSINNNIMGTTLEKQKAVLLFKSDIQAGF